MSEEKEITAIILAGGKSSRMKEDKGLVYFNGKMLVEHVIQSIKKLTDHIIIITANVAYHQFGYPCYEDAMKEKGPLGGIITGLVNSSTQKNLLIACDMPFLTERLLKELISSCGYEDVLITEHLGKAEPLCSVYDRNCIMHLSRQLEQNHLKITHALEGLKTRVISFDKEEWFLGNEFANINSMGDFNKYRL